MSFEIVSLFLYHFFINLFKYRPHFSKFTCLSKNYILLETGNWCCKNEFPQPSYFLKKCSLNLKNFSKFYSGRYGVLFFFVKTKPSTDNSGQERICFGEKKHALGREMFWSENSFLQSFPISTYPLTWLKFGEQIYSNIM